jgi:class 3 adenylate cyclase
MTNGATVVEPKPISGSLTSGGPVNGAGRPFVLDAVDDTSHSQPNEHLGGTGTAPLRAIGSIHIALRAWRALAFLPAARALPCELASRTTVPSLRAGISLGPAVVHVGDYYGNSVNLASRVTGIARPGSVLSALAGGAPGALHRRSGQASSFPRRTDHQPAGSGRPG